MGIGHSDSARGCPRDSEGYPLDSNGQRLVLVYDKLNWCDTPNLPPLDSKGHIRVEWVKASKTSGRIRVPIYYYSPYNVKSNRLP